MKASGNFTCLWTEAGRFSCWGGSQGRVRNYHTDSPAAVVVLADALCVLPESGLRSVRCFGPRYDGTEFEASGFAVQIPHRERGRASGLGIVEHEICTLRNGEPHCAPLDPGGVPSRRGLVSDDTKLQAVCNATHTCGADRARARPRAPGLGVVKQIVRGEQHTCALDVGGRVHCWGNNVVGQLGDGSLVDRKTPVRVNGLPRSMEIAAGTYHTCARSAEAIHCWGRNTSGELREAPIPDASFVFKRIVAGDRSFCAVDSDDRIRCWARGRAVQAKEIGPVVDFAWSNELEWCAVERAGGVMCWPRGAAPRRIDGIHSARAIIPGASCAVLSGGGVSCWGKNEHGQLGDGTTRPRTAARPVAGVRNVVQGSADHNLVCVRAASGDAQCWGALRSEWSLKKKTPELQQRPSRPEVLASLGDVVQLDLPCARRRDGSVVLFERHCRKNKCKVEVVPVPGVRDATNVTVLDGVACVVRHASGELTFGVSTLKPNDRDMHPLTPPRVGVPFAAPGVAPADVAEVVNVWLSVCARISDGRVLCNRAGEAPVEIPGVRAKALAGAGALACALLQEGGLRCWSTNYGGEVGAGTTFDPTALFGVRPVRVLGD